MSNLHGIIENGEIIRGLDVLLKVLTAFFLLIKFASKTPAASHVLNIADKLCGLLTSSTKTVKFFILQFKTLLIRSNLLGKIDIYNFFTLLNYIQKVLITY